MRRIIEHIRRRLAVHISTGLTLCENAAFAWTLLLPQSLQVSSTDPILKVHILRALRLALSQPLHHDVFLRSRRKITFRAQFDFMRGDHLLNQEKQKLFTRPVLNFARYTSEKAIPTTLGEQLTSGGIDYDPFRLYESWANYNHRKKLQAEDFDPFQDYKKDPDYNL